jgi:hypothetical protein
LEAEGYGGTAQFLGNLSRSDALQVVARSRIALVLAQNQHHSIPGKLYESVAMGVPTAVVTERGSATWAMAEAVGALPAESGLDAHLKAVLLQCLSAGSRQPMAQVRHELSYAVRADSIEGILRSAMGDRLGRSD